LNPALLPQINPNKSIKSESRWTKKILPITLQITSVGFCVGAVLAGGIAIKHSAAAGNGWLDTMGKVSWQGPVARLVTPAPGVFLGGLGKLLQLG
jgi:hypothetical protein